MAHVMAQHTLNIISGNTKKRIYTLNALFLALGDASMPANRVIQNTATLKDIEDQIIHIIWASSFEGPAMNRSYRVEFELSSEASRLG
mmetsp:Transcript_29703/g.45021  ORF Transcript_29703/g.45021 Transcript_29703/m.45021 type:complete len:88 (+) Transcript_29703:1477-1740(+)